MLPERRTPLIRLGNLFPHNRVYAKCEFLGLGGSFKIRGASHLMRRLTQEGHLRPLVVPSMGNTALGAAAGAKAFGLAMVGVVPQTITRAKDDKLRALGVELIKIAGGGTDLLHRAKQIAEERGGYFLHPHLDPLWTDGYQGIVEELLQALPDCRSLVFPVGGGGLLMGVTEFFLTRRPVSMRLIGCESYNYPTYAHFEHARTATIADGLILETPHPPVQERINSLGIKIELVKDPQIRAAMKHLYETHALVVEPSSAVTTAFVRDHLSDLEEPICVIFTGENIAREDFHRLIEEDASH